jgi:Nif-specific regulatory protein
MSALLWKGPADSPRGYVPLPIAPPGVPTGHETTTEPCVAASVQGGCIGSSGCPGAHGTEAGNDERRRLIEAMEATGWVQAKAARRLGITPRQISYALRKYDIAIKKF